MANLTRFDPLARLEPLFGEPFEDLFRRMLRPVRWDLEATPMEIRLDVSESDDAYTVKAELPGVKKDDIHVEIDGDVVKISTESKSEKKVEEKGKLIRSERYCGALYRSFTLGHDVDETSADAKYADGVLELTLPKKAGSKAKTLAVH